MMMTALIVSCLFIATGVAGIFFMLRKNARPTPQGVLQWVGSIMSVMLIGLSSLIIALIVLYEEPSEPEVDFSQVPAFEFQLVSNQEKRNISDYSGRVILLNFWATWCQPCITELPELDELQLAYGDVGLTVMTVSDESIDELQLYSDLLPQQTVSGYVEYESLPEPFQSELASGRPVTYVIDGGGTIRERVRGAGNFEYFEGLVTPWLAQLAL